MNCIEIKQYIHQIKHHRVRVLVKDEEFNHEL